MVIVAAVDRSDSRASVVRESIALAEAFDEEIHAVHVMTRSEFVDLETTSVDRTDAPIDMAEIREIAAEVAEEASDEFDFPVKPVGLMGDPADEIVEYAADHGARYVVIGPRKRSPVGKAVFGSVAQSVLLSAKSPVVSVIERSEN